MIPESGGEMAYIKNVYGSVPAFLAAWTQTTVSMPSGGAIIALTCGEYVTAPLFEDDCGMSPAIIRKMIAVVVVCKYRCQLHMPSIKT